MDLNQFLRERRPRWERLTALLDRIDRRGLRALEPREVGELFSLYRLVSSDLNLVQTRTGNPALLEYLEGLVGRAYANLAVPREATPFRAWWQVLRHYFPATLRAQWRPLALAFLTTLAGVVLGFAATFVEPSNAEVFLPAEQLAETPRERVARLEAEERSGQHQVAGLGEHAVFSSFLFTHNIRVTVLGFALGLTFGVGTVILLFYNGAMLGSLAALYLSDGVMTFFVAWIGPHGAIELPCVLFGCTAGLMLARAQYRRDAGSVLAQVRHMRPALIDLLVGTATLLVLAGLIEGGFSQINEPTLPYSLKIVGAAALFAGLLIYAFWVPAKPRSPFGDETNQMSATQAH